MKLAVMTLLAVFGAACGYLGPPIPAVAGAARSGDAERIAQLARAGADVNERGGVNGWTPLMHAVHKNQPAAVRALLAAGADSNATANGGTTALIMAAGYGYADIVRTLLVHGANPRAAASDGYTPLSAAVGGLPDIDRFTVGRCQTDTVKALLEKDATLRSTVDQTSLRIARAAGCKEVVGLIEAR